MSSAMKRRMNKLATVFRYAAAAALVLGLAAALTGYWGPLKLNPEAGGGPLLAIPAAAFAAALGAIIGSVAATLNVGRRGFVSVLGISTAVIVGLTLYASLPKDRFSGSVIDAEVRACQSPDLLVPAAEARWEKLIADNPWDRPRPNWKSDVRRMLARERGVVVDMRVHRRWNIYEQRKPWNRGRMRTEVVEPPNTVERYFARDADCTTFSRNHRDRYGLRWEASRESPPTILPTFLGLHVLTQVPGEHANLLSFVFGGV
jgi:hypothetical protein